jgi:hypothetical protein
MKNYTTIVIDHDGKHALKGKIDIKNKIKMKIKVKKISEITSIGKHLSRVGIRRFSPEGVSTSCEVNGIHVPCHLYGKQKDAKTLTNSSACKETSCFLPRKRDGFKREILCIKCTPMFSRCRVKKRTNDIEIKK